MLRPSSLSWPRAGHVQAAVASTLADYVALTKPPIILLLLVTALGGMFLAAEGVPPLRVTLFLMLGGAAAAGGASAINHYLDRDIDSLMVRTRRRPLPQRRISPPRALVMGVLLNVFAFALLAAMVNLLSAALTLSGTLFYVFIYTWWLKRATPQNIVIGGAAGAVPPLAGWAAVTGGVDVPALWLFAIVFFWTPPHFWALALIMREDYSRAGIPMMPVVKGVAATQRSILAYTLVVVATSLLLGTSGAVGWVYLSVTAVLGTFFLYLAWTLLPGSPGGEKRVGLLRERRLYLYSLAYLFLLFFSVVADSVAGL